MERYLIQTAFDCLDAVMADKPYVERAQTSWLTLGFGFTGGRDENLPSSLQGVHDAYVALNAHPENLTAPDQMKVVRDYIIEVLKIAQ